MCLLGPLVCAAFFPRAPLLRDLSSSSAGLGDQMMRAATLDHDYVAWLCRSLAKNRAECSEPNEPRYQQGPRYE